MFDMVSLLREALKSDFSATPTFVTMKALRDALIEEFSRTPRAWTQVKAKEMANAIIPELKIDVNQKFIELDNFDEIISLNAKVIRKFYEAVIDEFGEKTFWKMLSNTFELTYNV